MVNPLRKQPPLSTVTELLEMTQLFVLTFIEIDHNVEHPLVAEPRDLLIFRFQVRTYDVFD